jgi:sulfite reductase beta subunit-like hemoprotein
VTQDVKKRTGKAKNEVIPYLPQEIDEFEAEIKKFQAGQVSDAEFMAYRLLRGTYGQRQPQAHMLRVKIPGGTLTAEQLEALGEIARRYAPLKKGHFTTRENMQFHHVKLDEVAEALRVVGEAGLTTREACGNTVRNVVTCPLAGVCKDEPFDITPYLIAYARRFVRHPITQKMPRKFKTAFSGCEIDCAITPIHDLGFIPVVKREDGKERRGFKIVVGGGLSIMPKIAPTLYEFVPEEEYLRVCEAVLRVFNKSDELRKNRMMARIKVLIHRIGIDKFRELVEQELQGDWAKAPVDPRSLMDLADEEADIPPLTPPTPLTNGGAPPVAYLKWWSTNVIPQRQDGYHAVVVSLPLGDVFEHQFPVLAEVVRQYASRAKVTQQQNLVLRYVPKWAVYQVWQELDRVGLADPGQDTILDVVSCPGTDSCKLGITSSMGLNQAVREGLTSMNHAGSTDGVGAEGPNGSGSLLDDPLVQRMHIHISGCPNACGQHHIGDLGFHGAAMKVGNNQVPSYELFVGGARDKGLTRIGERVPVKVPAKKVPELVKAVLEYYKENRQDGEPFREFVDRIGVKPFEELAKRFKDIPPLGPDSIEMYMDHKHTVLFKVERGEGECSV